MDADVIVPIVALVVFGAFFGGVLWWAHKAARRARDQAERFARDLLAPRGFVIDADGGGTWTVRARGELRGYAVLVTWVSGSAGPDGPTVTRTLVTVPAPSLPAHFGLMVGPSGVVRTHSNYPLVTGDASFDTQLAGWTDHPQLAPMLLHADVRSALLALRRTPGSQLSALTGTHTPEYHFGRAPAEPAVHVSTTPLCLDAQSVEAMLQAATGFADAVRRLAHPGTEGGP